MADVLKSTRTAETQTGRPTDATAPSRTESGRCNTAHGTPWGRLRGETGWSLRELARRSGVNAGEISNIERGLACPTPAQALAILATIDNARILDEMRGRG
jgi:ribosome-binding protein aMBF1 (putative translation factor)